MVCAEAKSHHTDSLRRRLRAHAEPAISRIVTRFDRHLTKEVRGLWIANVAQT
jgi:hypothetical protein